MSGVHGKEREDMSESEDNKIKYMNLAKKLQKEKYVILKPEISLSLFVTVVLQKQENELDWFWKDERWYVYYKEAEQTALMASNDDRGEIIG